MGGKTATSTSQVQIPPEVLAQYRAVNARAEKAADQPFQKYSDNPDAFVAPLTASQQAAEGTVNAAQGMTAPYFQAATDSVRAGQAAADPFQQQAGYDITGAQRAGAAYTRQAVGVGDAYTRQGLGAAQAGYGQGQQYLGGATGLVAGAVPAGQQYTDAATGYTTAGGQAVNPTGLGAAQINQFMSPYLDSVAQGVMGNLRQQQGQEQSSLQGNQIMRGSFGGSRAQLDRANLARQQDLASSQVLSGIYNQGYGQALGAAQQQQGVQLGAAQANRAALQQTGQALAGLGQQAYGQRMGAGQALADFGNMGFQQGMGLGQAQMGAGQQLYTQRAGAGQQLYSQGMGASSARAGLGQQLYGQGITNANTLAGLGTGAQAATLQGAQAQAGMGQMEQQTQQAGLSALYNQFQQELGYPFQTTNFLSGIAYGQPTGSTTTSTQPSSFFGGLFRRHGGRVRRAYGGGLATPEMSELLQLQQAMYPYGADIQGHLGGGPHGTKLPAFASAKPLTAKAPEMKSGSIADAAKDVNALESLGKSAGSAYDWATGNKPMDMNYDPSKTTASIDDQVRAMGGIDESGALARGAAESGDFYRGGLVRPGYAKGGLPYTDDGYVPDDEDVDSGKSDPKSKVLTTNTGSGGSGNGLGNAAAFASLADKAIDAAPDVLAFLGFNRGGLVRPGYDDGGDVSGDYHAGDWASQDDDLARDTSRYLAEHPGAPIDSAMPPAGGLDPRQQRRDFWGKVADRIGEGVRGTGQIYGVNAPKPGLGGATTETASADLLPPPRVDAMRIPETPPPKPAPPPQSAPPPSPPPASSAAVSDADWQNATGLGAAATAPPPTKDAIPGPDSPEGRAALASMTRPSSEPPKDGWFKRNQSWLVPALKGLGAMASSNSRYLGTALLQGVAGGAGAYEDVQDKLTERERQEVETQRGIQRMSDQPFDKNTGTVRVYENGRMVMIPWDEFMRNVRAGKHYNMTPYDSRQVRAGDLLPQPGAGQQDNGAPAAAPAASRPATNYKHLDDDDVGFANKRAEELIQGAPAGDVSKFHGQENVMSPFNDIRADADTSRTVDPQIKQLASVTSRIAASGSGPISERLLPLQQWVNDAMRKAGHPEFQIGDPSMLADTEEMKKVVNILAGAAAKSGGQHAYAAIEQGLMQVPQMINSPKGMGSLMADILVQNQRTRDLDGYASDIQRVVRDRVGPWSQLANYAGDGITDRFQAKHGREYQEDKQALSRMFSDKIRDKATGKVVPVMDYVINSGTNLPQKARDQIVRTYGPRVLRYFDLQ